VTIDLNRWHHAVHQVTGAMAVRFNKAGAEDLRCWAEELHRIAAEMEAEANQHDESALAAATLALSTLAA
jgi:endogenous inhibitor of DNA gyrase (YacG/DUF329 family)